MNPTNGHTIARTNEVAVLYWVGRLGWCTARDIGRLHWPNASDQRQHRAARNTLQGLVDSNEILRRNLPGGGAGYVLARRGSLRLHEHGHPWASAGDKLRIEHPAHYHRHLANTYLITRALDGWHTRFEHEVLRGHTPIRNLLGQKPDGFALTPEGEAEWLEAEVTWKSHDRRNRLIRVARELNSLDQLPIIGTDPQLGETTLDWMTFVASDPTPLDRIATTMLNGYEGGVLTEAALSRISLVLIDHTEGLVYRGVIGRETLDELIGEV